MFRKPLLIVASLALLGTSALPAAHAAGHCRDAKGKFTKCEAPKKATKCRDAKGKFAKCPVTDAAPAAAPAADATKPS